MNNDNDVIYQDDIGTTFSLFRYDDDDDDNGDGDGDGDDDNDDADGDDSDGCYVTSQQLCRHSLGRSILQVGKLTSPG